jgi:hypothetical protein
MNLMQIKSLNKNLVILIKIFSTLLIFAALGLEIFNIYMLWRSQILPHHLKILIWVASFAIFSHLIEGILAGYYAYKQGKNAIKYGFYTFFTGTISLLELWP